MTKNTSGTLEQEAMQLVGDHLTKAVSDINKDVLATVVGLENDARNAAKDLQENAPKLASTMADNFAIELGKAFQVPEEEKDQIKKIFSNTMLENVGAIPEALYGNLKEGKGVLFNGMLNEKIIDTLEGILEFKQAIDEKYPGLSDVLVTVATVAITAAVISVSPAAGIALQASGIMEFTQDFLKTENLERTTNRLRDSMAQIEQDKELSQIKSRADQILGLAQEVGIAPKTLNDAALSMDTLKEAAQNISNTAVQSFMKEVTRYTDEVIASSHDQIAERMSGMKDQMIEDMKKNGMRQQEISAIEERMNKNFADLEKTLGTGLTEGQNFFEKVTIQQEGATKFMEQTSKMIDGLNIPSKEKEILKNAVAEEVKDKIVGPVEQLQENLKNPDVKNLAKKEGSSLRTDLAMERAAKTVDKALGKEAPATGRGV